MVIADIGGSYRFGNLPPGEYRLAATFDASEASGELMDEAEAKVMRLEAGQKIVLEPSLWMAP